MHIFMEKLVLPLLLISTATCADFFDNYIEVPSPPPQSLEALPKCGEGSQKGKFKCVPYFNCDPSTNTVVTFPEVDGSNVSEPRLNPTEPLCPHHLQVCCQIANGTSSIDQHGPTVTLNFEPKCGVKNENNDTDDAAFGEFPWMVGVFNGSDTRPFCGGSILSPIAVLTAAHCVEHFRASEIVVRAGEWNLQSTNEAIPHQERHVSEIIIHDHYLPRTFYNDVAILILKSSLTEARSLGTVCLSAHLESINQEECFVSGWGKFGSNDTYPDILKKVTVSTVVNKECEKRLKKKIGNEFLLDESFVCAQESSKRKICKGDGGGPLVCPNSSRHYFQIGIVSWGVACNGENPGVYTNVALFKDWIDFKVTELGYSLNSYTAM